MTREIKWPGEPNLGGWYTEKEIDEVVNVLKESLDWRIGFKASSARKEFEDNFANFVDAKHAICLNGGGTALDIAIMCLKLKRGDEVISPAIGFSGTHLPVIGQGGQLVFCEVDPKTLNVDVEDVARRITKRTKAILITHMNGLSCDMDALEALINQHRSAGGQEIKIIIDAARSCGGWDSKSRVGKRGWITAFSFQTKKLMTTLGEGGMITTEDPAVAEKARQIRGFGDKKIWGSNFLLSKLQAKVGNIQLSRLDEMNDRRVLLGRQRTKLLDGIGCILPPTFPDKRNLYYLYNIILPNHFTAEKRDLLISRLAKSYGIGCVVANPPTYLVHSYIYKHTKGQRLPISESVASRLVCPSLHPLMSDLDNTYISEAFREVYFDMAN